MSFTLSPLRASLRPTASSSIAAARSFQTTSLRRGTNPVTGGSAGSTVGEDKADVQAKNALVPVFMALGVTIVGYIGYSTYNSSKIAKQEVHNAPHPGKQQTKNIPAGSQENQGTRG